MLVDEARRIAAKCLQQESEFQQKLLDRAIEQAKESSIYRKQEHKRRVRRRWAYGITTLGIGWAILMTILIINFERPVTLWESAMSITTLFVLFISMGLFARLWDWERP